MTEKIKGKLIVLEGGDGSGKSTVLEAVQAIYGEKLILTREPGGTAFAEDIRHLALKTDGGKNSDAITQFCMMWASRAEHFNHKIRPTLESGTHVISDRMDSSTWAYQIYGQNGSNLRELFPHMRKAVMEDDEPVLYIYLDVDPAEGMRRKSSQIDTDKNHFDDQTLAFHTRVREGYLDFFQTVPHRVIDANQSKEKVKEDFLAVLKEVLGE